MYLFKSLLYEIRARYAFLMCENFTQHMLLFIYQARVLPQLSLFNYKLKKF
jgi:hypothetical protein